jgi:hypothetical protein
MDPNDMKNTKDTITIKYFVMISSWDLCLMSLVVTVSIICHYILT